MSKYEFLLSHVEMQCIRNPESIAVIYDNESFSCKTLEISANQLANYLKHHNVFQGDIVPLYMRRSPDLLAAMLAVWKLGAAYVCLDRDIPSGRLAAILDELQPKCVVTEPALLDAVPEKFLSLTCQDPALFDFSGNADDKHQVTFSGEQAVYLVYTSGSTGQPKGVLIRHDNLANYIFWFNKTFQINRQDVFNFNTSPAFDFAVTCLHAPLVAGAKILVTSEADVLDMPAYFTQLIRHRVTFVKWTPSYFKLLLDYVENCQPDLSHLRYIMIAGEELLTHYLERWFAVYPSHTIINEYGPTETTVGITTHVVTKATLDPHINTVPIGLPVSNTTFYLVNTKNQQVVAGEAGELWIGGDSVGSGYYQSPQLTRARFIRNPFASVPRTLYRTGDLVRQLTDGSYVYVGRLDNQLKINGYRVEIHEVERCLLAQPEIDHACVIVRQDDDGDRYLQACIVPRKLSTGSFDQSCVHKKLSQHLPAFMLPRHYHLIDKIPLTANGKLDHRALLASCKKSEVASHVE